MIINNYTMQYNIPFNRLNEDSTVMINKVRDPVLGMPMRSTQSDKQKNISYETNIQELHQDIDTHTQTDYINIFGSYIYQQFLKNISLNNMIISPCAIYQSFYKIYTECKNDELCNHYVSFFKFNKTQKEPTNNKHIYNIICDKNNNNYDNMCSVVNKFSNNKLSIISKNVLNKINDTDKYLIISLIYVNISLCGFVREYDYLYSSDCLVNQIKHTNFHIVELIAKNNFTLGIITGQHLDISISECNNAMSKHKYDYVQLPIIHNNLKLRLSSFLYHIGLSECFDNNISDVLQNIYFDCSMSSNEGDNQSKDTSTNNKLIINKPFTYYVKHDDVIILVGKS